MVKPVNRILVIRETEFENEPKDDDSKDEKENAKKIK